MTIGKVSVSSLASGSWLALSNVSTSSKWGGQEDNEYGAFISLASFLLGSSHISFESLSSCLTDPHIRQRPFQNSSRCGLPLHCQIYWWWWLLLGIIALLVGFPGYFQQLCNSTFINFIWLLIGGRHLFPLGNLANIPTRW